MASTRDSHSFAVRIRCVLTRNGLTDAFYSAMSAACASQGYVFLSILQVPHLPDLLFIVFERTASLFTMQTAEQRMLV